MHDTFIIIVYCFEIEGNRTSNQLDVCFCYSYFHVEGIKAKVPI